MRVIKNNSSLWVDVGAFSLTFGFIKGFYLGFQIDSHHFSLDVGVIYLDIYW